MSNQGFDEVSGGAVGALLAAVTMLACSICIVTGFWALMASITFWTIEGEGILWALDDMYDHLRWPLQIFPPGLRMALSTVYPAGFAITVPASALTGRLGLSTALIACATAAAFLIAARLVWRVAIRRYEGANS
ncbi:MAG: transporter permease [Thermoleophilia bacterium]|nr:transporter permease [Thermoleophilia bacterium]